MAGGVTERASATPLEITPRIIAAMKEKAERVFMGINVVKFFYAEKEIDNLLKCWM